MNGYETAKMVFICLKHIKTFSGVNLLKKLGGRGSGFKNWGSWVPKVQLDLAQDLGYHSRNVFYAHKSFYL